MHRRLSRSMRVALASLFVLVIAGCSRQTTAPVVQHGTALDLSSAPAAPTLDAAGGNRAPTSYVDLGVGRSTVIRRTFRVRVKPKDASPGAWEEFVTTEREMKRLLL